MGHIVCRKGFAAKEGKCLQVTGKAPKKALVAFKGKDHNRTMPSAMPSNEAKQEVRGTRKPQGVTARGAYRGREMSGGGGAQGIIKGGSDSPLRSSRNSSKKRRIPSGPKMSTVSGGTGHRRNTPNNANSHIITDPMRGNTPAISNSKSLGRKGYQRYIKNAIKDNGDYNQTAMPSNNGTGGGNGKFHSQYVDYMGKGSGKRRGKRNSRRRDSL